MPHARLIHRSAFLAAAALLGWLIVAQAAVPPNLDAAIAAQRALLEETPRDAALLNDLGNLLALAGETKGAEEAYVRALDVEPDRVATRFNLGLLYQENGRMRHARRAFEAVVKADPKHAWAHYQLGRILDEGGNRRAAIRHYARALRLEPRLSLAGYNPHIVDNELAVQGVLTAYSDDSPATLTPREYQHPDQLRALLVQPLPEPAEPVVEVIEEPGQEDSTEIGFEEIRELGPARRTPPPKRIVPPHRKGKGAKGYVPEWAREEESAQEEAAGRVDQPEAEAPPTSTAPPEATPRTPRPDRRQRPRPPAGGATTAPSTPAYPDAPQPTPPVYQPGVFSTGQLELRLIPKGAVGSGGAQQPG